MNNNLKHISIIVNESNGKEKMIWILINNNRIKIRIWVVYMLQESRITVKELAECYEKTENEIEKADQDNQHILVVGDFNCEIGDKLMTMSMQ